MFHEKTLEMGILIGAMSMNKCSDAESKVSQIWYIFQLYYWYSMGLGFIKCAKEFWHTIPDIALIYNVWSLPGRVAQSVTCLATDVCLTADPGVASSIPVRSHTFVEIDHEIISTVILLPSADLFKKGCCQLQAKVCARITG